ncbi:MAG: hypothetical protein AAF802_01890 [Planctomycetota bacterium]
MREVESREKSRGIWINSDEVHELRDHIQALRVGFSLLKNTEDLGEEAIGEVHGEIAESIGRLAASSLFKRTSAVHRVR